MQLAILKWAYNMRKEYQKIHQSFFQQYINPIRTKIIIVLFIIIYIYYLIIFLQQAMMFLLLVYYQK